MNDKDKEELEFQLSLTNPDSEVLENFIYKLQDENAKLLEVVKFYANQDNWQKNFGGPLESNARKIKNDDLWMDECQTPTGGKRAREVLKELEE